LPEKGEKYGIGITQLEFFVDDFLYPVFAKSRFRFICLAQSRFLHKSDGKSESIIPIG
jgi:hypothetical protein